MRRSYNLAKRDVGERWKRGRLEQTLKTSVVTGGGNGHNKGLRKMRAIMTVKRKL